MAELHPIESGHGHIPVELHNNFMTSSKSYSV